MKAQEKSAVGQSRRLIAAAAGLVLLLTQGSGAASQTATSYIGELTAMSVGSFSSIDQSRRDARYSVAEAEIVRIWPARTDGVWLYQEQSLLGERPDAIDPSMKDKPYFSRVIHSVETSPGVVRRSVHKLTDPAAARGAWRTPTPLAALSPLDLEPSECVVTATRIAEGMWRAESEPCPNTYGGASYAISLGVMVEGRYANWDRGFSTAGERVWGPEFGGYIFTRNNKGNSQ